MRIPRKKKKHYKKLWESKVNRKILVIKESISKEDGVWGCMIEFK